MSAKGETCCRVYGDYRGEKYCDGICIARHPSSIEVEVLGHYFDEINK